MRAWISYVCVCHGAVAIAHARQQQQTLREMVAMDYSNWCTPCIPKDGSPMENKIAMMAIAQHCSLIAIKGMEDSQKLIWCNAGKQAFFSSI